MSIGECASHAAVDRCIVTTYAMEVRKKPAALTADEPSLIITKAADSGLSPAQLEFNRLMKRLENARAKHLGEQAKLDAMLVVVSKELMPLIEELHRANRDMVFRSAEGLRFFRFSKKRKELLRDLIAGKARNLLRDPAGLDEKDIEALDAIADELDPPPPEEELKRRGAEEFAELSDILKAAAARAGVDLDLSGIDPDMDPAEFERAMEERFRAVLEGAQGSAPKKARKQTKAQLEKARKQQEQEEAKKRDIRTLYKQLAKALHPDLETDPDLKQHKEEWMKRLTAAYAADDLRELLRIEMEWLGEEASNLAAAGEEKLKVYCAVLKEQIADQKEKTDFLSGEPVYFPLRRFIHPFTGEMARPEPLKRELKDEILRHREMLEILACEEGRALMEDWADAHGRALSRPRYH
jgi:hypothetical protein